LAKINKPLLRLLLLIFIVVFVIAESIGFAFATSKVETLKIAAIVLLGSAIAAVLVFAVSVGWQMLLGDATATVCTSLVLIFSGIGIVWIVILGTRGESVPGMLLPVLTATLLTSLYRIDFIRKYTADSIREENRKKKAERDSGKIVI